MNMLRDLWMSWERFCRLEWLAKVAIEPSYVLKPEPLNGLSVEARTTYEKMLQDRNVPNFVHEPDPVLASTLSGIDTALAAIRADPTSEQWHRSVPTVSAYPSGFSSGFGYASGPARPLDNIYYRIASLEEALEKMRK